MAERASDITREWIEGVKAKLAVLPPPVKTTFSRQEAIIELAPIIDDMRARNYRIEDILPVLNADGQRFTAGALKTYLSRVPSTPSPDVSKSPRRAKSAAAVSSAAAPAPASPALAPPSPVAASPAAPSPGARLRAPDPDGDVI